MTWWSWLILGAVLLGAELFAVDAQFYLVFLGVSAAIVGLAGLFGGGMPDMPPGAVPGGGALPAGLPPGALPGGLPGFGGVPAGLPGLPRGKKK